MNEIKKLLCMMLLAIPFSSCAMDSSKLLKSRLHKKTIASESIAYDLLEYYKNASMHLTVTNKTAHNFIMYGKNRAIALAPKDTLSVYLARMKATQEIFPVCSDIPETHKVGADATVSFFDKDHNKKYSLQAALYTYFTTSDDLLSGAGVDFSPKQIQENSREGNNFCICYHGEAFEGAPDNNTQYNATVELQDNIIYSPKVNMKILGVNDTFFL